MNLRLAAKTAGQPATEGSFHSVTAKIASPQKILTWSSGEIKKACLTNSMTARPEDGGLFCCKIFGPLEDFTCSCGRYKLVRSKGIVCERCGVEVIAATSRRTRMAHIPLVVPVFHIWFLKSSPKILSAILQVSDSTIERLLYYELHIRTPNGGFQSIPKLHFVGFNQNQEKEEPSVTGAEALELLLNQTSTEERLLQIAEDLEATALEQQLTTPIALGDLLILQNQSESGVEPSWMILNAIPVLPPALRPMMPLGKDQFVASDLNDLYKRIINRNNRLRRLLELSVPAAVAENEKRLLQEAVDCLIDNGRRGNTAVSINNRPLKSLTEMLKGKTGRFRQNLLGKRVDYSGRSVITVGPELRINQCGIPRAMAAELFKPFLYQEQRLISASSRSANTPSGESTRGANDELLAAVAKNSAVLLNRAPTLHRLSVQAFEPVIIEGNAIKLSPLVCAAFNADFDGDQMAVHLPLTQEAQMEAKTLMLPTNNAVLPADGKPAFMPTQESVLGLYYGTTKAGEPREIRTNAVEREDGFQRLQAWLGDIAKPAIINTSACITQRGKPKRSSRSYCTTAGRMMLREVVPVGVPFGLLNQTLRKKVVADIISLVQKRCEAEVTAHFVLGLTALGFWFATSAGISVSTRDFLIPQVKEQLLQGVQNNSIATFPKREEQQAQAISIWTKVSSVVKNEMLAELKQDLRKTSRSTTMLNPVFMMVDSGARGSVEQIRQIGGMRGLMVKPDGSILTTPITSNFREGLSTVQHFISAHGARKGLADTALMTANSGYLTRRLVDVAQDTLVLLEDCSTKEGIRLDTRTRTIRDEAQKIEAYHGRTWLQGSAQKKFKQEEAINLEFAEALSCPTNEIRVRSPVTCCLPKGVCSECYGNDVATTKAVVVGEAVGVIAAQSIGEPGTQLTMRTFHVGGTASYTQQADIRAASDGYLWFDWSLKLTCDSFGLKIATSEVGTLRVIGRAGNLVGSYEVPSGSVVVFSNYASVKAGDVLAVSDNQSKPIVSDVNGVLQQNGSWIGTSLANSLLDQNCPAGGVPINQQLVTCMTIPSGAHLVVSAGQLIDAGQVIGHRQLEQAKNRDITGGLLQVADVFEGRTAGSAEILARATGIVTIVSTLQGWQVAIKDERSMVQQVVEVEVGQQILVKPNQLLRKGDTIVVGSRDYCGILRYHGTTALACRMIEEIQAVYRSQGVSINSKHIEVIVRRMLRFVVITSEGNTGYFVGEQVERADVEAVNRTMRTQDKQPALYESVFLGITRSALAAKSFVSAASFQQTSKVLASAATLGLRDTLCGLKENVIVGRMIPAGTGFMFHQHRRSYANS